MRHLCVLGVGVAACLTAAAQGQVLGGQIFSTGGMVHVEVLPPTASFTSELWLYSPTPTFIALNHQVGATADLGPFAPGTELIFGIFVRDTGTTFQMGPGFRNPDGLQHNVLTVLGPSQFDVGFEDILGGGDMDYDDNNFRFTGSIVPAPAAAVPMLGLGALALGRRRRA